MELEPEYDKSKGYENSHTFCYTVEARYNHHEPCKLGDQIFDKTWRRVSFKKADFGVPTGFFVDRVVENRGFLNYSAAQSLRWWLHANAEYSGRICLETRLVKHKVESSCTINAVSYHDCVGGEDRSSIMAPDERETGKEQE